MNCCSWLVFTSMMLFVLHNPGFASDSGFWNHNTWLPVVVAWQQQTWWWCCHVRSAQVYCQTAFHIFSSGIAHYHCGNCKSCLPLFHHPPSSSADVLHALCCYLELIDVPQHWPWLCIYRVILRIVKAGHHLVAIVQEVEHWQLKSEAPWFHAWWLLVLHSSLKIFQFTTFVFIGGFNCLMLYITLFVTLSYFLV